MRILDKEKIAYKVYSDDSKDKQSNGMAVAKKLGKNAGKLGLYLEINSKDLAKVIDATFVDIIR